MRMLPLGLCVWLAAGCGVAREPLGELPEAGSGRRSREVTIAGRGDKGGGGSGDEQRDAGTSADAADGGQGGGGAGGSAPPSPNTDAGVPDRCEAEGCDAAAQPLEAYCDHEHARCPLLLDDGRSRACYSALLPRGPIGYGIVTQRASFPNTCGGTSIRIRLSYGTVEYHYGADEKLRTVTTLTAAAGGPCNATFYRYGDIGCAPAGDGQEILCGE